jgi:predicted transcriptional regulator
MAQQPPRTTLTIRIDPALHQSLAAVADAEGLSMNAVAEAALRREISLRASELSDAYQSAAEAMRAHAAPRLVDVIDAIAANEATAPEPVPTRHIPPAPAATFEAIIARARRVG